LMFVPAGAPARGATLARTGVARAELAALERTGVALERRGFIPATRGAPDVRAIIAERARMHAQLRARGDVFAWVGHDLDLLERAVRLPASDGPARLVIASPDFPPTFGNMLRFPLRERAPNGGFVKINDVDQLGVALQMMRSGYRIGTPLEVLASGVARRPGTAMLERDIPVYRANQEAFLAKYGHRADVAAIAPLARSKILATERHIAAGELDAAQTAADELDAMLLQLRYKPGSKLDVPELRELGSELWSIRRGIDYVDMPMGQLLADQLQVPVHAARGEVELRDVGGVTRVFVDGRELTAQTRAELMTEFHPEPLEAAERQKRLDWMQSVADEPIDPQDFGAINTYEGFPEADAIALERLRTSAMRHASSLDGALGVDLATATPREVRRAFRRWSRAHHPDALRAGRAMTDDEYRAAGHRFQEIHAQYQDYVARARP